MTARMPAAKPDAPKRKRAVPLTDGEKACILRWHGEGLGRNVIAENLGRSEGVVTKVVHAAGLSFDRTPALEAATKIRQADLAERRTLIEEGLANRVEDLIKRMGADHIEYVVVGQAIEQIPHTGGPDHKAFVNYARATASLASAIKTLREATKQEDAVQPADIDAWFEQEVDAKAVLDQPANQEQEAA
jgi:hypothetical protein